MDLGIILPNRKPAYTCGCGKAFYDRENGIRHAVACATSGKYDDEIAEAQAQFEQFTKPRDEEQWRWGRKRQAEGKPGFKRGQAA